MKRLIRIALLTLVLSLALTAIVSAQGGAEPDQASVSAGTVALLLAPLVAAAAGIERVIEMFFDFFEGLWLGVARAPGQASTYAAWARQQVQVAREALTNNRTAQEQNRLETALQDAQARMEGILKRDPYKTIKRVLSLLAGIVLGLIAAFLTRLQMFKLLGADLVQLSAVTPESSLGGFLTTMDIIVTGLVIGTGSAPVHSLIGILQKSKDAIDEARALAAGKANATQIEILKLLQPAALAPQVPPAAAAPEGAGREGKEPAPVARTAVEQAAPSTAEVQRTLNRLLGR